MSRLYRAHVHDHADQGRWLAQADFRRRPSRDEIPPRIPLLYDPGRYEVRINVVQDGEEWGLAGWLQDAAPVRVIFRQWRCSSRYNGDIIALFPDLAEARPPNGMCSSFEHVGQHGAADLARVMSRTRPASPDEYAALKRELEAPPYRYKLAVVRRTPRDACGLPR